MKTQEIDLSKLRTDGGTQAREEISNDTVREYAAAWEAGDDFPPIDVFYDGATYWIADGFHRFYGARDSKLKTIECVVHSGTLRDAILFSVGANRTNGLRRTNADKKRAVLVMLEDEEWVLWSDPKIAEQAGVSHNFVGDVRRELESDSSSPAAKTAEAPKLGKDGKKRKPRSGGGGGRKKKPAPSPVAASDGPSFKAPDVESAPEIVDPPAIEETFPDEPLGTTKATKFNDKGLESHYGKLSRGMESRAKAMGGKGPFYKAAKDALIDFLQKWNDWRRAGAGAR